MRLEKYFKISSFFKVLTHTPTIQIKESRPDRYRSLIDALDNDNIVNISFTFQ